jgi:hypothetical protein
MSILAQAAVDNIIMPMSRANRAYASLDPLSSAALLSRLYYDYAGEETSGAYLYHLSNLARNPSLPPEVCSALFTNLMGYESSGPKQTPHLAALSCFFVNPSTTFEQVLSIVRYANELNHFVSVEELETCKSVIDIFDKMMIFATGRHRIFFSNLLCSPMVSDEDFISRVRNTDFQNKLIYSTVYADPRFVPDAFEYVFASKFVDSENARNFDRAVGIVTNPHADSVFLAELFANAEGHIKIEELAYDNLNCPLELSASYHIENIESYKWRPSYLLELEAKVEARLTLISGEGPWEDLPLSWKLKIITG